MINSSNNRLNEIGSRDSVVLGLVMVNVTSTVSPGAAVCGESEIEAAGTVETVRLLLAASSVNGEPFRCPLNWLDVLGYEPTAAAAGTLSVTSKVHVPSTGNVPPAKAMVPEPDSVEPLPHTSFLGRSS